MRSELIGYARLSSNKQALKVSLSKDALEEAETYASADGVLYISLIINADRLQGILNEEREVTSVCQIQV